MPEDAASSTPSSKDAVRSGLLALGAGGAAAVLVLALGGSGPTGSASGLAMLALALCGALLQQSLRSRLLPAVVVGVGLGAQLAIQQRTHLEMTLDLLPYLAGGDVLPEVLREMARCARELGAVALGAALVVAGLRLPGARVAVPVLVLGGGADLLASHGLSAAADGLDAVRQHREGAPELVTVGRLARLELLAPVAALGLGLGLVLWRGRSWTELGLAGVIAVLLWPPLSLAASWMPLPVPVDPDPLEVRGGAVVSLEVAPLDPGELGRSLEARRLSARDAGPLWGCTGSGAQTWLRRARSDLALSPPAGTSIRALLPTLRVAGRHGQYHLFLVARAPAVSGVLGPWLSLGGVEFFLDRPAAGVPRYEVMASGELALVEVGEGGEAGVCAFTAHHDLTVQELAEAAERLRGEPACELGLAWTVLGEIDGTVAEAPPCP